MPYPPGRIGQALLDVPFPQMIRSMGLAVAEAQYELDLVGIKISQMMSGKKYEIEVPDPAKPGEKKLQEMPAVRVNFGGEDFSLLELGFTPTFYQFVDTIIEVKVSISMNYEHSASLSASHTAASAVGGAFLCFGGARASTTSVSASFASKFQYSAEGSSLMRTKLVTVPTPAVLEERIRALVDAE